MNIFKNIEAFQYRKTLLLAAGVLALNGCASDMDSEPLAAIGGQVDGLGDEAVVLTLNGEEDLSIEDDGPFQFETGVAQGETYTVTITAQPGDVACASENATGSVGGENVNDIEIDCGELRMSSRHGDASVSLDWWPGVDGDLLYSTDRDCDWSNVQACGNGGAISDVSGGTIDIIASDEGLELDQNYHFALQMPESHSATAVGVAPRYQYGAPVLGLAMDTERVYAGGYGRYFGGLAQGISWFQTGSEEMPVTGPNYRMMNGFVQHMIDDPNGGWFVVGQFAADGDFPNQAIARLHPDGTVDQDWEVTLDGNVVFVSDILIHDDHLYVAGRFGEIQGSSDHAALARLTLNGELDEDFNPEVPGNPTQISNVDSILVSGDRLYVAGNFHVAGDSDINIGVIDPETGEHIDAFDAAADGRVTRMLLRDDRLYIAGQFEEVNGVARVGLALLDPETGDLDGNFTPNVEDALIRDIELINDRLFVAGAFNNFGGTTWRNLAAVHADSGVLDIGIETEADLSVLGLDYRDGYLYVAGLFSEINGVATHRVARLEPSNGFQPDESWHLAVDGIVVGLADTDHKVAVLGQLWTAGGKDVGHLAAFDLLTGELDESWGANVGGFVVGDVTLHGGQLFATGIFNQAAGESRTHAAAFDLQEGNVLDWNPEVQGSEIVAIEPVSNGNLALGGHFSDVGGEPRTSLAIVDSTTGSVIAGTGNPEVNGMVLTLSYFPSLDYLFVGGSFSDIDGSGSQNAALVTVNGLSPVAWNPNPSSAVWSMIYDGDDHVLAGGNFIDIGGGSQERFALLTSGGNVVADSPEADGTVYDMSLDTDTGQLLVAGRFTEFADEPFMGLAELTLENEEFTVLGPTPGFNDEVRSVTQGGDRIAVGGLFSAVDGQSHAGFVLLDNDFQPLTEAGPSRLQGSQPAAPSATSLSTTSQEPIEVDAEKAPKSLLPLIH